MRSLRNREQKLFTAERIIRQLNQIARHSDIETSGLIVESDRWLERHARLRYYNASLLFTRGVTQISC